jgi:hypothetical protein
MCDEVLWFTLEIERRWAQKWAQSRLTLSEGYPPGAHVRVLDARSPFKIVIGSIDGEANPGVVIPMDIYQHVLPGCRRIGCKDGINPLRA